MPHFFGKDKQTRLIFSGQSAQLSRFDDILGCISRTGPVVLVKVTVKMDGMEHWGPKKI